MMSVKENNEKPLLEMNDMGKTDATWPRPSITILGTGDFGKALAKRLSLVGYDVVFGSRSPDKRKATVSANFEVLSIEDSLHHSDIIFVAIPRSGYDQTMTSLKSLIDKKILVDVSNRTQASCDGPSHAEYLASLIPGARVVKGFNVISAWALENDIYGGSRLVYICGDDPEAKREVMEVARTMQFIPVDQGSLKMANIIEKKPHELFPSWRVAMAIFVVFYLIMLLYFIIGSYLKGSDFNNFPLRILSILNAFSTIGLLDMVYLPGIIAALLQLTYGTKYRRFPRWLDLWMKSRKQLGLIAMTLAAMHGCMSTLYWSPGYKNRLFQKSVLEIGNVTLVQYKTMIAQGEAFLTLGVVAMTSLFILGVTSLPTVLNRMSWREWNFVQSGLGYFALVCGLLHFTVYLYEFIPHWKPEFFFRPTLLVIIFGYITVLLRLILLMPCLSNRIKKIRSGWERESCTV